MSLTLYNASKAPSRAFKSVPSRLCTQVATSSGQVLRPPWPAMTAMLVPTVCRKGFDGLRMQWSKDSCISHKQINVFLIDCWYHGPRQLHVNWKDLSFTLMGLWCNAAGTAACHPNNQMFIARA